MTGLRKLERDFVSADLAAVTGLLAQLGDEDVMARMGLELRRDELQQTIAHLDEAGIEPAASAALFFGGGPVVGSRGIETEFAGSAISKFQDIVAKVLARESGGLGQRGVVPNKAASTLHITNIVRGSFGFLLEEVSPQPSLMETSLKTAMDETSRLLRALGEPDEEQFRTVAETIDQRTLGTAREFFELMRQSGATLRLVAGTPTAALAPRPLQGQRSAQRQQRSRMVRRRSGASWLACFRTHINSNSEPVQIEGLSVERSIAHLRQISSPTSIVNGSMSTPLRV